MKIQNFDPSHFVKIYSSTCVLLSALIIGVSLNSALWGQEVRQQASRNFPADSDVRAPVPDMAQPSPVEPAGQRGSPSTGLAAQPAAVTKTTTSESKTKTPKSIASKASQPKCGSQPANLGDRADGEYHAGNLESALKLYQQSQKAFIQADCITAAAQTQVGIDRVVRELGLEPVRGPFPPPPSPEPLPGRPPEPQPQQP